MRDTTSIDTEHILWLAKEKQWLKVIDSLPPNFEVVTNDISDKHQALASAVGQSYAAVAKLKGDANFANEAIPYLMMVWEQSYQNHVVESDVFWSLVDAMYIVGRQQESVSIIKDYQQTLTEANERVKVGEWLAMVYEVLGDNEQSVRAHKEAISGIGGDCDKVVKFDSFNNTHVATAYINCGMASEWLNQVMSLWENVILIKDETLDIAQRRFMLMFAITKAVELDASLMSNDITNIIDFFEVLSDTFISNKSNNIEDALQWFNILISKYTLYSVLKNNISNQLTNHYQAKAKESLQTAKQIAHDFLEKSAVDDASQKANRKMAFQMLHNLGMLCRKFDKVDATTLLKQAASITIAGDRNGPTFFWLSASILETSGNREEALCYLKRVSEDKLWGYGGLCVRPQDEFYQHEAFSCVREDKSFIDVIKFLQNVEPVQGVR